MKQCDCGFVISEVRIRECVALGLGVPTQCIYCAGQLPKPTARMMPEGKTGAGHLVYSNDPEIQRQIIREHNRGR